MRHCHLQRGNPHAIANEAKKKKGSNRSHPFLPSYVGGGDQRHLQNQEKSTKQSFYFSFFFL
jgi:hypothetical protein